jgi:hypothetical protein
MLICGLCSLGCGGDTGKEKAKKEKDGKPSTTTPRPGPMDKGEKPADKDKNGDKPGDKDKDDEKPALDKGKPSPEKDKAKDKKDKNAVP